MFLDMGESVPAGRVPDDCRLQKKAPAVAGARVGGGGGTADPYLSIEAGLYLHPVARMRGVLFTAYKMP